MVGFSTPATKNLCITSTSAKNDRGTHMRFVAQAFPVLV
jgi:hypothetical protein